MNNEDSEMKQALYDICSIMVLRIATKCINPEDFKNQLKETQKEVFNALLSSEMSDTERAMLRMTTLQARDNCLTAYYKELDKA